MRQNWYFLFSEICVLKKRYIKFFGTRQECVMKQSSWHHLEKLIVAVLPEQDFEKQGFLELGYKELDIEKE